jgi:peptide/nickel transport system permease protein
MSEQPRSALTDVVTEETSKALPVPGLAGFEAVEAEPVSARKRARFGVGAWLAAGWMALIVALAVLAPVLPLDDPDETFADCARKGPSFYAFGAEAGTADGHILGCDQNGRDMLSRLIWGARSSLTVAAGAVLIGLVIGGFLGLVAGFYRGRLEGVITGALDIMLAIPPLVFALALVAVLSPTEVAGSEGSSGVDLPRIGVLILALGIVSTPILGRITRASALSWSEREFVLAARAQGAKNSRIVRREVLPNVLPAMFSIALLGVAVVIVAEGGLALLGVGVQPPTPSWGNIISEARGDLDSAPYIVFEAAIMIFLSVLSLNFLGDVVRARTDVREGAI